MTNLKYFTEIIAYLVCMAELYGQKFKLSIHAVVLIILDLFLLTGISDYGFPIYLRSLLYIGIFLYGWLFYKETVKHTIINCLLAAMIVTIMQLLLCLPLYFLNIRTSENQEMFGLFINIVCIISIFIIGCKLKLNKVSSFFFKRDKVILIISFLILIGLGVNLYQIRVNGLILGEQYIQLIYFILLLGFTVGELQKTRLDAEKKKMQLEMNSLYYEAYDQLIMLVRERQHDMKNHINAILSMIYTSDNYDELVAKQKEYCGFVTEQNEETKLLLSSGNPLVAGFLYSKIQRAKSEHIAVTYQIEMKKTDTSFQQYELIEIIGILFDNAVEALLKAEKSRKKMIVSIKENDDKLNVVVANVSDSYDEDMTERFFEVGYSSKGNGRGIGLSKLKRMVYDRNGEIMISNEKFSGDNFLTFTVKFRIK